MQQSHEVAIDAVHKSGSFQFALAPQARHCSETAYLMHGRIPLPDPSSLLELEQLL